MTDLCRLIFWTLVDLMRARATLEAEIWVLRQQINVLRRAAPRRQPFGIFDRLIFVSLYRLFPKACNALAIVKPDTKRPPKGHRRRRCRDICLLPIAREFAASQLCALGQPTPWS